MVYCSTPVGVVLSPFGGNFGPCTQEEPSNEGTGRSSGDETVNHTAVQRYL